MVHLIEKRRSMIFGLAGIIAGITAGGAGLCTLSSCTSLSPDDQIQFYYYHEFRPEI